MPEFTIGQLDAAIVIKGSNLKLVNKDCVDRVAQIIARFLRETLLANQQRFSFETVFLMNPISIL